MEEPSADHKTRGASQQLRVSRGRSLRKLLAHIWLECRSRRWWLVFAGVLGVLPLLAPLLPRDPHDPPTDSIFAAVAIFATIFAPLIACAVGVSLNFRELSEQRRAFFLIKPLEGSTLALGKYLAGLGLVLVLTILMTLPGIGAYAITLGQNNAPDLGEGVQVVGTSTLLLALILVPLLTLGFWAGIALGTRTQWLGLDLVVIAASATLAWWCYSWMSERGFLEVAEGGAIITIVLAVLGLLVAGFISLAWGRAEAGQIHGLLSLSLWTILGITVLGQFGYFSWYVNPGLEDLETVEVLGAAPAGTWVEVRGPVRGRDDDYLARFLVDIANGRSISVGWDHRFIEVAYSLDGTVASWVEWGPRQQRVTSPKLQLAQLDQPDVRRTQLGIPWGGKSALSPDGQSCALITGKAIRVFRTGDGSHETTLDLSKLLGMTCFSPIIVDTNILRCYTTQSEYEIVEVDLKAHQATVTGRLPKTVIGDTRIDYDAGSYIPTWERKGRLLKSSSSNTWVHLTRRYEGNKHEITFINGRTGYVMKQLDVDPGDLGWPAQFLTGERFVVFNPVARKMKVFARHGALLQTIDIDYQLKSEFLEVEPNILIVRVEPEQPQAQTAPASGNSESLELLRINLSAGAVTEITRPFAPLHLVQRGGLDRIDRTSGGQSPSLFTDSEEAIVFLKGTGNTPRILLASSG